MWADRVLSSDMAQTALRTGAATRDDLQRISDAWRQWAADPDGWISLLHAELICRA
jgi:hypothetical protein